MEITLAEVNGEQAVLGSRAGVAVGALVLEIAEGKVAALRAVANPDKLG